MAHHSPPRIKKTRMTDSGISKYSTSIRFSPCLSDKLDQVPVRLVDLNDADPELASPFSHEECFLDHRFCNHAEFSLFEMPIVVSKIQISRSVRPHSEAAFEAGAVQRLGRLWE